MRIAAADSSNVPVRLPASLLDILLAAGPGGDLLALLAEGQKQVMVGPATVLLARTLTAKIELERVLNAWIRSSATGSTNLLAVLGLPCGSTIHIGFSSQYHCQGE